MSEVEIEITWQDIMQGKRFTAYECPISIAAGRVFSSKIGVGLDYLIVSSTCDSYMLGPEGNRFREDFDRGFGVQPCKFKVTPFPQKKD